ncbi:MAG: fructosamine kinase family protein [Roseburia sp.]|nr:fructosamine kinase family protein [Roseburia sp.]
MIRSTSVAGGDINAAYQMELSDGTYVFMKSNKKEKRSFFTAEAVGIDAIARMGAIGTPKLLCTGTDDDRGGFSFLLMEWIRGGSRLARYQEIFANELAGMHRAPVEEFVTGGRYGFWQDNYIGAGEQVNAARDSWIEFFRDCRLEPQFERAGHNLGNGDRKKAARLLDHLGDFLVEPEKPSLLHGDLWSGNVITGNDGKAWLIDPAVYVGHAEADLAMTELFGGFSGEFYRAYRESGLLQPGYERRRDLYNLYHLLNHLNLFGRSYLASVRRIMDEYIS